MVAQLTLRCREDQVVIAVPAYRSLEAAIREHARLQEIELIKNMIKERKNG